jgi:hypothetical protein
MPALNHYARFLLEVAFGYWTARHMSLTWSKVKGLGWSRGSDSGFLSRTCLDERDNPHQSLAKEKIGTWVWQVRSTSPVLASISTILMRPSSVSFRDMGRHLTTTFTHSGSFLDCTCFGKPKSKWYCLRESYMADPDCKNFLVSSSLALCMIACMHHKRCRSQQARESWQAYTKMA